MTACTVLRLPHASPTPSPTPEPTPLPAEESAAPSATVEPLPPPMLSEEDYPRVDGSTATIPLSVALLSHACAIPRDQAELYVNHSTTPDAYYNLLSGSCDLLIVYEPPTSAYEYATMFGGSLRDDVQMAPIGRDALVFLVNESNPVRTLGALQIQSIYKGDISQWSAVGGEDKPIDAFQRDPDSGSQTLMRVLVMGDTPMAQAPAELVPGSMGELIEKIIGFDNSDRALGYSVYYYVRNMVGMQGLRVLAVDGIEPSAETIANGQYPYTQDFYVAIRTEEPEGSPARLLYDFLQSDQGQALVEATRYVPAR